MKKQNSTDEIFDEICTKICLLHLVSMGEFNLQATIRDAQNWHYEIKEDCTRCPYNENCLCCLYVGAANG